MVGVRSIWGAYNIRDSFSKVHFFLSGKTSVLARRPLGFQMFLLDLFSLLYSRD
jgi:hypothetical protein